MSFVISQKIAAYFLTLLSTTIHAIKGDKYKMKKVGQEMNRKWCHTTHYAVFSYTKEQSNIFSYKLMYCVAVLEWLKEASASSIIRLIN